MSMLPPNAVHPPTREDWRTWLEQNHARQQGVWLVTHKKATGKPHVDYDAAVEEALCFGWVDSLPRKLDAARSLLYFAPRKPGSGWSRLNKERAARLIAQNRMAPAGLEKIEAAKQDGSWAFLDAVEALEIPPDLSAALAAHPPAATYFDAFPRSARRGILEWIASAKRPETHRRNCPPRRRKPAR